MLEQNSNLLAGFRRGDVGALDLVYRRYADKVEAFLVGGFTVPSGAQRFRFDGIDASQDVQNYVQETFARAFSATARKNYDGRRPFDSYLLAIARNIVIDELRRAAHRLTHLPLEQLSPAELRQCQSDQGHLSAPDHDVACLELAELVRHFVGGLGEIEREMVFRRYCEDLSQRRAAEAMGLSRMRLRTVEARVHRKAQRFFRKVNRSDYPGASAG